MSLGCEKHRAFVYDRGAARRLFELTPLTTVRWERLLDDMSHATVFVADPSTACQRQLARVHPNRHELVIYRGQDRVWEGPISRMAFRRTSIEIEAKDVMYYAYRTVLRSAHNNTYPNIVSTLDRSIDVLGEMSRKEALDPPINVLPYVTAFRTANDAQTSKYTAPYEKTAFEDVDGMAHHSGMDYTVLGRSILLFDTHTVWSTSPQVTEADFLGDIITTYYGLEMATHATVVGLENLFATTGSNDPFYGEWEIVDRPYDEDGTEAPTHAALLSQAVRNLDGRNPVPLHVRIPDNTQLNPNGVLRMRHLVPGIRVPLRATLLSIEVSQMQKLKKVAVAESGDSGEQISVTLTPASKNDEESEEQ